MSEETQESNVQDIKPNELSYKVQSLRVECATYFARALYENGSLIGIMDETLKKMDVQKTR